MKKLLFTLAIILSAVAVNAQEGTMWLGGGIGVGHTKIKDGDSGTNFKVMPQFGYYFSDNMAIGINAGFSQIKYDAEERAAANLQGFEIKPFLRYAAIKSGNFAAFIDAGVGYEHLKNKDIDGGDNAVKTFEVGVRPGVSYNFSDCFQIFTQVGFLGYQNTKYYGAKINHFGLDLDMRQAMFGAAILF